MYKRSVLFKTFAFIPLALQFSCLSLPCIFRHPLKIIRMNSFFKRFPNNLIGRFITIDLRKSLINIYVSPTLNDYDSIVGIFDCSAVPFFTFSERLFYPFAFTDLCFQFLIGVSKLSCSTFNPHFQFVMRLLQFLPAALLL